MTDHTSSHPDLPAWAHTLGRRRFVQGAGAAAGAATLAGVLPAGLAHAALPAGASAFKGLPTAVRAVDTRDPGAYSFQRLAGNHIRLTVAGSYGVPATATAVVATVTGVNFGAANYISVFPTGVGVPEVSNLNLPNPGDINANLVTVKLGAGGAIDLFSRVDCDMIVDVVGYYEPIDAAVKAGRFVALPVAMRVLDTRPNLVASGSIIEVDLSSVVPADASNAVINLTATECTGPGYCTVFPAAAGAVPNASSLNWTQQGATRASAVIVPVANDASNRRKIKIFTLTATKLIVDVTGYFTGETSSSSTNGAFVPLDPVRILDTRIEPYRDPLAPGGVLWPGWTVEAAVPGEAGTNASSVLINLTGTATRGPGYLTVAGARRPLPPTSNVNWTVAGTTVPNHAITPVTLGSGIQVFTSHGAAVVVDLNGYFLGNPALPQYGPPVNPAPPPIDVPWVLEVPRLGLRIQVRDGNPDTVTNAGYAWHWEGTGLVGQHAHIGIFAHRTEAGGPLRYIDHMQPGDTFWLDTLDGRRYVYQMTRRDLTDGNNENILAATRAEGAPSLSLIACTVGYDSSKSGYQFGVWAPTSTLYRIIVTGSLINWHTLW